MWDRYLSFRDAFAAAMDERFYTIDYLDWIVTTGRAGIWFGDKSSIVAEIRTFPTAAKAVCGVIAAGDMKEIAEVLIPLAEAWGQENGCQFALIESRPGWEKIMKKHGYTLFQASIVKDL